MDIAIDTESFKTSWKQASFFDKIYYCMFTIKFFFYIVTYLVMAPLTLLMIMFVAFIIIVVKIFVEINQQNHVKKWLKLKEGKILSSNKETNHHIIQFSKNKLIYNDANENLHIELSTIHKIILFGQNPLTQSLNIYYENDQVYTFYANMPEWKLLLDKLATQYSFKLEQGTTKQILYQKLFTIT